MIQSLSLCIRENITEQGAEELAVKLTRIWARDKMENKVNWRLSRGSFRFGAEIQEGIQFRFFFIESRVEDYVLVLARREGGRIVFSGHDGRFSVEPKQWEVERREQFEQFAAHWLPVFRRGCYLSGCPIECTEHEKLEWTLWLKTQEAKEHGP